MLPTCPNAPNIQGRPTPNRYETGGIVVAFLSRSGAATINGMTEFDVSNPPRKYLYGFSNHGLTYREISGGTPWQISNMRTNSNNQFNPATGAIVSQYSYEEWRNGGAGGASVVTLLGVVPTATQFQIPYDPDWQADRLKRYFSAFNENPSENSPIFGWGSECPAFTGSIGARMWLEASWATDHWALTLHTEQSHSGGVGTFVYYWYLALVGGDNDPGDAAASGANQFYLGSVSVSSSTTVGQDFAITLPPGVSVRVGSIAYSPGATYDNLPYDLGTYQAQAGVNPWFYFPNDPADLDDIYAENLTEEDTFFTALGRGVYTPGADQMAVTNSLSGGLAAGSTTGISIDGVTVELQLTIPGLTVGNRYQLDVEFRDNTIGLTDYTTETQTQIFTATTALMSRSVYMVAPNGKERIKTAVTKTDLGPVPVSPTPNYQFETLVYWGRIIALGGTITTADLEIADEFVVQWKASGIGGKLRYVMPLLGEDWAAGIVPLIDRGPWGVLVDAGSSPFVDADFGRETGLVGGANKLLATPFTLTDLAGGANGGWGFYVLNQDNGGTAGGMIGTYWDAGNNVLYGMSDNGTDAVFRYGSVPVPTPTTYTWPGTAPTRYNIYGQRLSQTDRRLFIDGAKVATSTGSDNNGASSSTLRVMGDTLSGGVRSWAGTLGIAYWTNGALTDSEVSDLNDLIEDYLITPSGK